MIEDERNFELSASELFPFTLKLVRKYIIKYLFMFGVISYVVIQQLSSLGKIKHIHSANSNLQSKHLLDCICRYEKSVYYKTDHQEMWGPLHLIL